tara:strand:- start:982 stop:2694 length:1713 start_codon:yes stop_codon:yes gene_type:complete
MDISTIFIYLSVLGLCVAGLSIYVYWNYCRFVRGASLWLFSILAISLATVMFGLGSAVLPRWVIFHFGNSFLFLCPALMGLSLRRLNQRGSNWVPIVLLLLGGVSFNLLGYWISLNGKIIFFSLVFGTLWLDPAYQAFRAGKKGGERVLGYIFLFVIAGTFLRVLGTILFEGDIQSLLEGGPVQQLYICAMGVSLLFFLAGYILMLDSRYLDRILINEAKLRVAIDHSPYGMVVTGPEMRVVSVNARLQKVSGYTLEDFQEGGIDILSIDVSGNPLSHEVKAALSNADDWRGVFLCRRKTGEEFWAKTVWSPIRMENGEVSGFFGVIADVTRERQLEDLKNEIEHVMRHDLKTPLNAILHLPDLIKESDESSLSSDQLECLDLIRESGESMLEQINGSLNLYRIEEGTYQVSRQPGDLRLILSSQCKVLETLGRKRGVEFRYREESPPTDSLMIMTDFSLCKRMVGNLLKNAVEASPTGGLVEVKVVADKDAFTVSIHNEGAIPLEARGRFFSKFNTVGKFNGTGLGAYGSKSIADLLGYGMSFETSEESGTTLIISIPRSEFGSGVATP